MVTAYAYTSILKLDDEARNKAAPGLPGYLELICPWANAPAARADRVLVKTGAAHRFLVTESLTLPRPGERAGCLTGHQVING